MLDAEHFIEFCDYMGIHRLRQRSLLYGNMFGLEWLESNFMCAARRKVNCWIFTHLLIIIYGCYAANNLRWHILSSGDRFFLHFRFFFRKITFRHLE
ncbi:hypothetical protein Zm00014a_020615 [Zea mays]|jgi:hypothetical protein|uniref:Uncharacterized protein n=1 Tax=Zea mays TaxID=4577 RepID=A0A317Y878_MAIZE|nr:hypothetical protein Zm00014a_020615 [Zea mays]